jgi:flagellar assembly protein FliH
MAAPHKFLFDRSFDQPDPLPRPSLRQAAPPAAAPEPSFSRDELEAARREGYEVGRKAALAEAMQSIEERAAAILKSLADGLEALLTGRERDTQETQRLSLEAMRVIAQKAVPALCRKEPLVEIESLVTDCLREAFDEPRIVLRVADPLFDVVQRRLGALTTSAGFAGKVVLLADETLGPGDARVEWAEGGAERDTRRLIGEIDGALARALEAVSARPTPSLEGNHHE